jgi:hypothetical protein
MNMACWRKLHEFLRITSGQTPEDKQTGDYRTQIVKDRMVSSTDSIMATLASLWYGMTMSAAKVIIDMRVNMRPGIPLSQWNS